LKRLSSLKKTDIRQAIKKEEDEKSAALLTKTVEEPLKVISPEMFFYRLETIC
jgi:hypothetical protein